MGHEGSDVLRVINDYLLTEAKDCDREPERENWRMNTARNIPKQRNGNDCGVFVCMFADFLVRRAAINFEQADIPDLRRKIKMNILSSRIEEAPVEMTVENGINGSPQTRGTPANKPLRITICIPFSPISCGCCDQFFEKVIGRNGLIAHVLKRHAQCKIVYECLICGLDGWSSYQSVSCHFPLCKGPKVATGEFICEERNCDKRFQTTSGLSQHIRHKHPVRRSKMILDRMKASRPPGRPAYEWTEEEGEKVKDFLKTKGRLKGYGNILAEIIKTKTPKQIRERARRYSNLPLHEIFLYGGVSEEDDDVDLNIGCDKRNDSDLIPPLICEEQPEEKEKSTEYDTPDSIHMITTPTIPLQAVPEVGNKQMETRAGNDDNGESDDRLTKIWNKEQAKDTNGRKNNIWGSGVNDVMFHADPVDLQGVICDGESAWRVKMAEDASKMRGQSCKREVGELIVSVDGILAVLSRGDAISIERIESMTDRIHEQMKDECKPLRARKPKKSNDGESQRKLENNAKRRDDARTQEIFRRNPRKLAEIVVENDMGTLRDLSMNRDRDIKPRDELYKMYKDIWGRSDINTGYEADRSTGQVHEVEGVLTVMTPKEIIDRIRRMKKGGAPGPDNITRSSLLKNKGVEILLAKLFAVVTASGHVPGTWKRNRTIFIPKPNKDLAKPDSWRPLTIGSMVYRIYAGLMEKRIRRVTELNIRQRGFQPGQGCQINCATLDSALRYGCRGKAVCGAVLDMRRAFDAVPHNIILNALKRKGLPYALIELMRNIYDGCTTELDGQELPLLRGVKQGDPLSALLFNIVIDDVFDVADGDDEGEGALGYADDIILLNHDGKKLQEQMHRVERHMSMLGLTFNSTEIT
ncbi:uncharacterized protein LOC120349604 [Nilaparvata lugens]|uniref:uncharacterized protein LOC120349604 n=1 Tax=Nilaparvata lugens TaxID=108931 RepID=UPI00193D1B78|nr:uncharacterized protein LOC120349604 [Nilaparvata lugens]